MSGGLGRPAVSMVMIARDEEAQIRPCFESFWPHVDEVVLCDTGSRDRTLEEACRFADERDERDKLVIGQFQWCNDFAEARNYAHTLARGDWHCWCDLDDRVVGAHHLRRLAADASLAAAALVFEYRRQSDDFAILIPRLLEASCLAWRGRVCEHLVTAGSWQLVAPEIAFWAHTRNTVRNRDRYEEIHVAWLRDEPLNLDALRFMWSLGRIPWEPQRGLDRDCWHRDARDAAYLALDGDFDGAVRLADRALAIRNDRPLHQVRDQWLRLHASPMAGLG